LNLNALHSPALSGSLEQWRIRTARSWAIFACVFAFGAASVCDAQESDTAANAIDSLVVEAALLTETGAHLPAGSPPTPNVVSILQERSADDGDANDYVLEHLPIFSPEELASSGHSRSAYTVWNTFDPDIMNASLSGDGRSIDLIIDTKSDFYLVLKIESDDEPIAPGIYADGDSWFRVNTFQDLGAGRLSLDIEYALPIPGGRESARLRAHSEGLTEGPPFSPMTAAEWLSAQPGGVAVHWVRYDDSARAGPPVFGDQFDPGAVLSYEEALLRVARDRDILKSREPATEDTQNKNLVTTDDHPTKPNPKTRRDNTRMPDRERPTAAIETIQPDRKPSPIDAYAGGAAGLASAPPPSDANLSRSDSRDRAKIFGPTPNHVTVPPPFAKPRGSSDPVSAFATAPTPSESRAIKRVKHPRIPTTYEAKKQAVDSPNAEGDHASEGRIEEGQGPPASGLAMGTTDHATATLRPSALRQSGPNYSMQGPDFDQPRPERTFREALGSALEIARAQLRDLLHTALEWWRENEQ